MTSEKETNRIKRLVADREAELGYDQIDLAREAKVSDAVIRQIENGELAGRTTKILSKVSTALGWAPGSLASMREGGDPTPLGAPALPPDVIEEMDALVTAIEDSAAAIRRMLARVERSQS